MWGENALLDSTCLIIQGFKLNEGSKGCYSNCLKIFHANLSKHVMSALGKLKDTPNKA